ncbi:tetratricopeptide repeat protein [Janthinobacterium sp. DSP2-3-3]|uniref:tetratricopeptide repeat protein n=1 Tax=Janthinobacterium sp. DSP2-3-3 TaxID=2804596 RepID=UPI003CF54DB9
MKTPISLLCACLPALALAAPYTPKDGSVVIEQLARRADATQVALRGLRQQLNATPGDLALATGLAQRYIALARSETDPRYLGYAQAALAPWWRQAAPPVPVRLLRATILQSTHHFAAALQDLDAVLAQQPQNGQAWLTRATVLTVQGDYAQATAACARLSALTTQLVTVTCLANVASVTGRAASSERLLDLTLQRSAGAAPELESWALTLLAEMATRRAELALAEARYKQALAQQPRDSYLLGAYADFLLDQRRPQEVVTLLKDQQRIDALLLRYALALQSLPGRQAAFLAAKAELAARFYAAMQRGDTVHQREQARYTLFLQQDIPAALQLAQQNWAIQKEVPDMRILLEAALAARNQGAAQPVLAWIAAHGVEDAALQRLVRQLAPRNGAKISAAKKAGAL